MLAYGDFENLVSRTVSEKVITRVYVNCLQFFDKKFGTSGARNKLIPNQELADELHKPVIKKFKNFKKYLLSW